MSLRARLATLAGSLPRARGRSSCARSRSSVPAFSPPGAAVSRTGGGGGHRGGRAVPRPGARRALRRRSSSLASSSPSGVVVDTDALLASYLSESQLERVRAFALALLERNKHMNLTGAATVDEVLTRHVADSLALIPAIERAAGLDPSDPAASARTPLRVLDVGSGAGFPGMVLAIARPRWEVTMLDTLQKRTAFLDEAAATCGATNVRTLWSRAEDAGRVGSEHREAYDIVTARAVAELRVLAELCLPAVRVGGAWVAAKNSTDGGAGEEAEAARAAVETLGGGALEAVEVESVGPDGRLRTAIISKKVKETPEKYPRRAGMPNKRPL